MTYAEEAEKNVKAVRVYRKFDVIPPRSPEIQVAPRRNRPDTHRAPTTCISPIPYRHLTTKTHIQHGHPPRNQLRRAMLPHRGGEGESRASRAVAAPNGRTSFTSRSPRRTSTASPSSTSSPSPSRSRPRRESERTAHERRTGLTTVPPRASRRRSTRSTCSSTTRSSPRCVLGLAGPGRNDARAG